MASWLFGWHDGTWPMFPPIRMAVEWSEGTLRFWVDFERGLKLNFAEGLTCQVDWCLL